MEVPKLSQPEMVQQILKRNEAAKNVRRERWESLWDDVMGYLWPQMGSMIAGAAFMPGEKRGQRCYDGTPESALDIMVAGLQAGTIPENYPWFDWELVPKWANTRNVRIWLQMCRNIALEFLAASNFGMATNLTYRHIAAFGTAVKFRQKDDTPGKAFGFSTLRLTDCVFGENSKGMADWLFWEFKTSARAALQRWGDDAPGGCKQAVASGHHEKEFQFLQAIFPREDYDRGLKDSKNMPFASWIIDIKKKKLIEESGFKTFPASIPRWDKLDDQTFTAGTQLGGGVYGRGPGIKCLQDMGVLNKMERSNLVGGEKMVNPALAIPDDGFEREVFLYPGAQNRWNAQESHGAKIEPINDIRDLPFAIQMQDRKANAIRQAFHVDVFLTFADLPPGMTATEATIRNQEKLVVLEPMISRQRVEHLERDLDWVFDVLMETGYFPPPPDEVFQFGTGIKNVFKSPLFMAQEGLRATKVLQAYQKAGVIVQARGSQDVLDNFDDDQALSVMMEADNVPAEILRDPKQRDKIRQARIEERKKMVAEQNMAMMAKAAGQLGKVKTGEGGGDNVVNDAIKEATGEGQ